MDPSGASPPPSRSAGSGPLVHASIGVFAVLLIGAGGYFGLGRGLLEGAWRGGLERGERDAGGFGVDYALAESLRDADGRVWLAVTGLVVVWVLVVVAWATLRGGLKMRFAALALLALYLGVESVAAPLLIRPLGLSELFRVQDPDHWPDETWNPAVGWNSDFIRSKREASDFRPEGYNIVFLGDSMTVGDGVPLENAFPRKTESILRTYTPGRDIKAANFAWLGSSPVLGTRRLDELGEKYEPDIVIFCLDMTDLQEDIVWRNMLERRGIYRISDKIPLTLRAIEALAPALWERLYQGTNDNVPAELFYATEASLEENRPYFDLVAKSICEVAQWCAERDIEFMLAVLPRHYQYSAREVPDNWEEGFTVQGPHSQVPFDYFAELAQVVDYEIFSLLPAFIESGLFPTCFRNDPHWNKNGHTVAAKAIANALSERVDAWAESH